MQRKGLIIVLISISISLATLFVISEVTFDDKKVISDSITPMYEDIESPLVISEIVSNNLSIISDSDGDFPDYIELCNVSDKTISLANWALNDDDNIDEKWLLPAINLKSNERIIVFASGTVESDNNINELHADFKINQKGETIHLFYRDTIKQKIEMKSPIPNMSFGLSSDGKYHYFEEATPGEANSTKLIEDIDKYLEQYELSFSYESGFYTDPIELNISVAAEGVTIKYTTDSTLPSSDSMIFNRTLKLENLDGTRTTYAQTEGTIFPTLLGHQSPYNALDIDFNSQQLAHVIRAQAFIGDIPIGPAVTKTYWITDKGAQRYSLPVLSLVTDPENLYSNTSGIYMVGTKYINSAPFKPDGGTPALYNQRGRDWERPVSIEYFSESGELLLYQDAGLRTFGGWSRANPKKSFKLIARDSYGGDDFLFNTPLVQNSYDTEGNIVDSYTRIVVRNGGNDWERAIFRDILMQNLVSDILDTQGFQPIILFLDGEYWGIYNLRETQDKNYIESHYDIDSEMVEMVNYEEVLEGDISALEEFHDLLHFCNNSDLSSVENWNYFEEQVDLESFINYFTAQIYFVNTDWPGNNIKFWRMKDGNPSDTRPGYDGKWRPILYDTDFGFSLYWENYEDQALLQAIQQNGPEWPNPPHSTILLRSMLKNDDFKEAFVLRMQDFLNSRFRKERIAEDMEKLFSIYDPEITENCNRWNLEKMQDREQWKNEAHYLISNFAENRPAAILRNYRNHFDYERVKELTLSCSEGGNIVVNGQYSVNTNQLITQYYANQQIELEVIAYDGYQFTGWESDSSYSGTKISVFADNNAIKALFRPIE